MDTFDYYTLTASVFTFFTIISNVSSLYYITKTFDTKQCLHHILCLDAIVAVVSAFVSLVTFSIVLLGIDYGEFSCLIMQSSSPMTLFTIPICNFMVSYIR